MLLSSSLLLFRVTESRGESASSSCRSLPGKSRRGKDSEAKSRCRALVTSLSSSKRRDARDGRGGRKGSPCPTCCLDTLTSAGLSWGDSTCTKTSQTGSRGLEAKDWGFWELLEYSSWKVQPPDGALSMSCNLSSDEVFSSCFLLLNSSLRSSSLPFLLFLSTFSNFRQRETLMTNSTPKRPIKAPIKA